MGGGKYKKRIDIMQRLVTTDIYGQSIPHWVTFKSNVPAELQIGSGREYYGAKRNIPTLSGIIKIRFLYGIKTSMRVYWGNKKYIITAVIPRGLQLNSELELHVEEIFAD